MVTCRFPFWLCCSWFWPLWMRPLYGRLSAATKLHTQRLKNTNLFDF
jgi:hypothetical protein